MAEKIKLMGTNKVRHVGNFDFKETYRVLFEWLVDKGYNVDETKYIEVAQAAGAKEVDISWTATKNFTNYFQCSISIRFHPLAMTSVELDIDGVKKKMNKGDLTIEFGCTLVKDYRNTFPETNFGKTLRSLYEKFLIRERIEQFEGMFIGEYEELMEYAKEFLILAGRR